MRVMIIVLGISAMIGCSKDTINKSEAINEQIDKNHRVEDSISESRANPYDSSGKLHNEVLGALRSYQKTTGDTTKSGMKDFLNRELQKRFNRGLSINPDRVEADFKRVQQKGLSNFLSGASMSDQMKQYFIRLDEITRRLKSVDQFRSFVFEISEIEGMILQGDLPKHVQESMLRITSITYHSGLFWKKIYDDNSWINPSPHPAEMRWWQWPIVTNADFLGGLFGFLDGGNRHSIEDAAGWMSGGAEGLLGSL